jgi:hypothetical protein
LNTVASLLATPSALSSMPSTMASFTANPLTLSTLVPLGSVVPVGTGSITCVDGSVVMMSKDCLNGVIGATGTSTSNIVQLTIINMAMAAVSNAPSSANRLAGSLLSTANTGVASILSNIQSTASNSINSLAGGLLSTAQVGVVSVFSNVQPTAAAGITNTAGNLLSTVGADISTAVGNVLPTASTVNNLPGDILAGSAKGATNQAANIVSQLSTIINGQSTVLPVVLTALNGNPTAVPMINTVMNGVATNLPVLNAPVGQLAQTLGLAKGRRRVVRSVPDNDNERGDF